MRCPGSDVRGAGCQGCVRSGRGSHRAIPADPKRAGDRAPNSVAVGRTGLGGYCPGGPGIHAAPRTAQVVPSNPQQNCTWNRTWARTVAVQPPRDKAVIENGGIRTELHAPASPADAAPTVTLGELRYGFDPARFLAARRAASRRAWSRSTACRCRSRSGSWTAVFLKSTANGRIPDFPVTRSHPPASWPSAANSSICRTYRKTAGEESRRRSPVANRWMRP